jgi:hypothetical protein
LSLPWMRHRQRALLAPKAKLEDMKITRNSAPDQFGHFIPRQRAANLVPLNGVPPPRRVSE